ncbi:WD40 repeat domain-containing protein [Crocosphaera watsonii]
MQRLPKHRPKNTRVILEKLDEIEKKINPPPKPIKKQPQVIAKIPQPTVKQKPSQVISNKSQGVIKKKTPKKKEHIFVRVIKTGLISTSIFGVLAFILVEGYVLFKYKYNILKNFTYPINLLYDFKLLSSDIRSSRFLHKTIRGHFKSVNSVAYSPDEKYLASGSWDNTVKIWEVKTGKLIRTFEGDFSSVAYSPDGRYLATYREPDFDTIENPVKIREVKTGKLIRTFEGYSILVAYSLDGKYLATESENTIKIWEVKTGKLVRTLTGHSDSVVSVAYSPDGKYLASGSWDNTVKIWEVKTGKSIRTLTGFSGWLSSLTSISYSPDGKYLAARCNIARVSHDSMLDDTVKKWDVGHPICTWEVATGKVIQTLTGHASNINSVAYSPDGKYLASSSSDRQIKIWRVEQITCVGA